MKIHIFIHFFVDAVYNKNVIYYSKNNSHSSFNDFNIYECFLIYSTYRYNIDTNNHTISAGFEVLLNVCPRYTPILYRYIVVVLLP